jgi:hypothetical protein
MPVLNLTRLPRASKISYFPDKLLARMMNLGKDVFAFSTFETIWGLMESLRLFAVESTGLVSSPKGLHVDG